MHSSAGATRPTMELSQPHDDQYWGRGGGGAEDQINPCTAEFTVVSQSYLNYLGMVSTAPGWNRYVG